MEFRLPPLGEGIDTVTVTAVAVRPGDAVQAGQNVLTVETDKAAVEVPVDTAGVVEAVLVQPGDKIPIDTPVLRLRANTQDNKTLTPAGLSSPSAVPQAAGRATTPTASVAASPAVSIRGVAAESSETPATSDFLLPELGEGIEAATVTAVLVRPGDMVQPGQNVVTVETDKAAVEVPIDRAGMVTAVHVQPGDKVPVGGRVLSLQSAVRSARPSASPAAGPSASSAGMTPPPEPSTTIVPEREGHQAAATNGVVTTTPPLHPPEKEARSVLVPASPAARRLARELGVSLSEVPPSGRGGRVTLDDIKNFVRTERQRLRQAPLSLAAGEAASQPLVLPPLPDFSQYGPVEIREVSTLRQTIARNLTLAWRAVPMVTQHDLADITDLEAGRKRIVDALPPGSPKITMTVLAIKACVAALKEFPHFNSSFDMNTGRLIYKRYYHIGIAVDTKEGLVVPVVRDADKKSIRDLAAEVQNLAEKARARKLRLEEMRGGTFTISNLGGIGGTAFTPIVNYPEVAILGLSRSTWQAVVRDGQIVPRLMLPLSLTYDHRVIDGADGCRFVARLVQLFSDPIRLLMET
jgi:pyruvate dehydrogenase E2 component (dihydrolipoamide acetyltransferase)